MRLLAAVAAAFLAAPLAQAGWSVPEGEPYHAEQVVVDPEPASRTGFAFRDGLLAAVVRAPGESQGPGSLAAWRWDGEAFQPVVSASGSGGMVAAVAAGRGHLAWTTLLDPEEPLQGGLLLLQEVGAGPPRRLGDVAIHSPPAINGKWLTWSSRPPGLPDDAVPATLHRLDLDTGAAESWPSPRGPCEVWVADLGPVLALSGGITCHRDGEGGLQAFDPATGVATPLSEDGSPFLFAADGPRLVWTAYREGSGRGTNLYVHDALLGTEQRVSSSPGRECCAALSGGRVAWLDLRTESGDRSGLPPATLYFKDLGSGNEYQVQGTLQPTGGPALDGGILAYNDAEGRLVALRLPEDGSLLEVHAEATVGAPTDAVADLTLAANVTVDVAWDLDGDGDFEVDGSIEVDLGTPREVVGRAVDVHGRVAVLALQVAGMRPVVREAGGVDDARDLVPPPAEEPSGPVPAPGLPAVALVASLALLALAARRR